MDVLKLKEKFKTCKLFKDLDENQKAQVMALVEETSIKAGTRIFEENSVATHLYIIDHGKVEIRMKDKKVDELRDGDVFGWSSVTDPYTFTAGAWTVEDTKVYMIKGKELRKLFDKDCKIGFVFMNGIASVISRRLKSLRAMFIDKNCV